MTGSYNIARRVLNVLQALGQLMRRGQSDRSGASAVELAIISPLLIGMMVVTADLGLAIYANMQVSNAVHAGAHYAIVRGFDESSISNVVAKASSYVTVEPAPAPTQFCGCASNAGITSVSCNSTCSGGTTSGNYARVSAQATYSPLIHYPLVPKRFTFKAQSIVRIP